MEAVTMDYRQKTARALDALPGTAHRIVSPWPFAAPKIEPLLVRARPRPDCQRASTLPLPGSSPCTRPFSFAFV
jgi:hypothetical protein